MSKKSTKLPQTQYTRYEVISQEDPETGDLIIPVPPHLLQKLGWKEHDEVIITIDEFGRYILSKGNK
jgi:hypothetical protein